VLTEGFKVDWKGLLKLRRQAKHDLAKQFEGKLRELCLLSLDGMAAAYRNKIGAELPGYRASAYAYEDKEKIYIARESLPGQSDRVMPLNEMTFSHVRVLMERYYWSPHEPGSALELLGSL